MNSLVYLHILAGTIAILSGFCAPFTKKGQRAHRLLGLTFMASILMLGLSGAIVAHVKDIPLSFMNGLLISYFIVTSYSTIKQPAQRVHFVDKLMVIFALLLTTGFVYYAHKAANTESGELAGFGSEAFIAFGTVAFVCTLLDFRFIYKKGLAGKQRVLRHLWRMFFPLLMSTAAFFLGQANRLPEALQQIEVLLIPVVFVVVIMMVWILIVVKGRVKN
ncbi:hypothetical protein [Alteromonas sp. KUL49]|uniref:hypothetical protein n=1 Tax=Alteromonas sp. KUL49 TaxID=2480798 RepID=UPI00102F2236|nr:hypothetical protein [Alteromonas sp. KUL49]TAP39380.1 hypothetical protein EYS00_12665 [Alteromonas sp. KUL49]GEA12175.1 hypothetical protein KUL49_25500 [Alteromonas sp. KUL49]